MMLSMISGEKRGPTSVLTGRGSLPDDTKFCRVFGEQQKSFASSWYDNRCMSALFSLFIFLPVLSVPPMPVLVLTDEVTPGWSRHRSQAKLAVTS